MVACFLLVRGQCLLVIARIIIILELTPGSGATVVGSVMATESSFIKLTSIVHFRRYENARLLPYNARYAVN
jgi:hypothetical protein